MPKIAKELGALAVSRIAEPGSYPVGKILELRWQVSKTGARSWFLRATVGERRRDIGLGSYPAVSLKDAHDRAKETREAIAAGVDPVLKRKETASRLRADQAMELTFEAAARRFMAAKSVVWRNWKHGDQWKNTLANYAYPLIGKMLVRHVTRAHVTEILGPIWTTKT